MELGRPKADGLLYGANGEPISSESGGVTGPRPLTFEERKYQYFDVELTEKGSDIIYHFWPPRDGDRFVGEFQKSLEDGFKTLLPQHADVRAEFTSREEAAVLSKHAEGEIKLDSEARAKADVPWVPRETYFVRVVGGTEYPLAEVFLKNRVFDNICKAIEAARS